MATSVGRRALAVGAVLLTESRVPEVGACLDNELRTYFDSPLWPATLRGSLGDQATLRPSP